MATESNTYNDYSAAAAEEFPLISNFSHWLEPDRARQLYDVNPVEADFFDFMKMGLMRKVTAEEIFHREANSRFDTPKVNASTTQGNVYGTADGGTNDPATVPAGMDYIQLHADSHTPSSGPQQGKHSYPRVGEIIQFKNGAQWKIYAKRTSVDSEHRLYLQKVQTSMAALSSTITQVGSTYGGDIFIVIGPAFEESTWGQTTGLIPTHKVFQSYLQFFGDFYEVSSKMENTATYPITWKGKPIQFTYEKGINDMEINLAAKVNASLLLQSKDDDGNLTVLDPEKGTTKTANTTQGYLPALELYAQKLLYDSSPTIALFHQIDRYRRKLQQGPNCMLWVGYEFRKKVEGILTQFGAGGGLVYDRKAVDLNVQQISMGGFTYNIKTMNGLDHAKFAGAPGFTYPHQFIVQPMIKIQGSQTGRSGAGEMLDAVNVIYKDQVGLGARGWYKIWETGANARQTGGQNKRVNREINIHMECGMQTVGAAQHIYGKPLV